MRKSLFLSIFVLIHIGLVAQQTLEGIVRDTEGPLAGAVVLAAPTNKAAVTNEEGLFQFTDLAAGDYVLKIRYVGYGLVDYPVTVGQNLQPISIELKADPLGLEDVVVSANRYETDRSVAPVEVNVLGSKMLRATQSLNLSEGLNFQPGVRVETNCQNCGFTQVRLNGLDGPYTQVLVNSRPVFSSLISVYGLEMIPSYLIEQVEVVKSGGSALYGANAIAGTINIITKEPVLNRWELQSNYANIDGASEWNTSANGAFVSNDLKFGISGFLNWREREAYDANGDGFTELVAIDAKVAGLKSYYKFSQNTKLSFDLSHIDEFRRGGNDLDARPEFTDITEQLQHNIWMYNANLDQYLNGGRDKLSIYTSYQHTDRDSYYGGLGGGRTPQDSLLAANAYGATEDQSLVTGLQWNHLSNENHAITGGVEYQFNATDDQIPGYTRSVDQAVANLGFYGQWEWQATNRLKLLTGLRYDRTDVDGEYRLADIQTEIDQVFDVFSPRFTLLYDINKRLQFRGGYARGFRAPQAFNEDLHISSAGGEPVFVVLSDNLNKETSDAWTGSLNYTQVQGERQFNVNLQGFYTQLNNPFVLVNTGAQLPNGSIVEEVRNGTGAFVSGLNTEINYAIGQRWVFQSGFTAQQAKFNESQVLFEPESGEEGAEVSSENFMRVPNLYGYFNLTFESTKDWEFSLSNVYTGTMQVPEILQSNGQLVIRDSPQFLDTTIKLSHHFHIGKDFHIAASGGVQNLFNSYQSDFQSGPTRDSDYIYGPARPRTVFFGLSIKNND
jgi:outer membrane receptor for ferrienterochelin and colicins